MLRWFGGGVALQAGAAVGLGVPLSTSPQAVALVQQKDDLADSPKGNYESDHGSSQGAADLHNAVNDIADQLKRAQEETQRENREMAKYLREWQSDCENSQQKYEDKKNGIVVIAKGSLESSEMQRDSHRQKIAKLGPCDDSSATSWGTCSNSDSSPGCDDSEGGDLQRGSGTVYDLKWGTSELGLSCDSVRGVSHQLDGAEFYAGKVAEALNKNKQDQSEEIAAFTRAEKLLEQLARLAQTAVDSDKQVLMGENSFLQASSKSSGKKAQAFAPADAALIHQLLEIEESRIFNKKDAAAVQSTDALQRRNTRRARLLQLASGNQAAVQNEASSGGPDVGADVDTAADIRQLLAEIKADLSKTHSDSLAVHKQKQAELQSWAANTSERQAVLKTKLARLQNELSAAISSEEEHDQDVKAAKSTYENAVADAKRLRTMCGAHAAIQTKKLGDMKVEENNLDEVIKIVTAYTNPKHDLGLLQVQKTLQGKSVGKKRMSAVSRKESPLLSNMLAGEHAESSTSETPQAQRVSRAMDFIGNQAQHLGSKMLSTLALKMESSNKASEFEGVTKLISNLAAELNTKIKGSIDEDALCKSRSDSAKKDVQVANSALTAAQAEEANAVLELETVSEQLANTKELIEDIPETRNKIEADLEKVMKENTEIARNLSSQERVLSALNEQMAGAGSADSPIIIVDADISSQVETVKEGYKDLSEYFSKDLLSSPTHVDSSPTPSVRSENPAATISAALATARTHLQQVQKNMKTTQDLFRQEQTQLRMRERQLGEQQLNLTTEQSSAQQSIDAARNDVNEAKLELQLVTKSQEAVVKECYRKSPVDSLAERRSELQALCAAIKILANDPAGLPYSCSDDNMKAAHMLADVSSAEPQ